MTTLPITRQRQAVEELINLAQMQDDIEVPARLILGAREAISTLKNLENGHSLTGKE